MNKPSSSRWYPTQEQLKDTSALERALRQVLKQHYDLADRHQRLLERVNSSRPASEGPPQGSGPTDTMLLGLRVAPVDVQTLADGATLKYSKKDGNFRFS